MDFGLKNISIRSNGLIHIKPKVRVTDSQTLSLVYTPGVGHICKVIEADPQQLYSLTIVGTAIAVISDGTGLDIKQTDEIIPYLEARSALLKQFYDIDAYPLIANRKLVLGNDEYINLLDNLSPAYKTILIIDIEESRGKALLAAVEASNLDCNVIISNGYDLKQQLREGALIKAILDSRSLLKPSVQAKIQEKLQKVDFSSLPSFVTKQIHEAYKIALGEIYGLNLQHATVQERYHDLIGRLQNYYIYGEAVFINDWGQDHKIQLQDNNTNSLLLHKRYNGMIAIETTFNAKSLEDLYRTYELSYKNDDLGQLRAMIAENPARVNQITFKFNYAGIITNGTAILGLGNIGPSAGLPVMEGKSVLFNALGGIDLMPICMKEKNPHKMVLLIQMIAPIFSAINLEDLRAPDCFPIEDEAIQTLPMAIMHDDQHGTAVVALAAIINALKMLKKQPQDMKMVINGAGAAGVAICKLLYGHGIKDILICDTEGIIYTGRAKNMNSFKDGLASFTNAEKLHGSLADAVKGRDIFIGVSAAGALTQDMVRTMNPNPFILALANPVPEIMPEEAIAAGAFIVATGRSDFPNQVNNSLAFPGIFRAAIDTRAKQINLEMKIAAAHAIADCIKESELTPLKILPGALTAEIPASVAKAVAIAAMKSGVARVQVDPEQTYDSTRKLIIEGHVPKL